MHDCIHLYMYVSMCVCVTVEMTLFRFNNITIVVRVTYQIGTKTYNVIWFVEYKTNKNDYVTLIEYKLSSEYHG